MDGKGIVKGNRWSGKMNYLQGTFLILNHSTTTRCNIMDHNYISLMGQIFCTRCGRSSDSGGICNGTHDITGMNGKIICKKCGRSPGGFETPCTENHDISPVMGKLMCRKCGTTGLLSIFQKSRCNSNHSIAVINGVVQCRRCGATKDWTNKRCGL